MMMIDIQDLPPVMAEILREWARQGQVVTITANGRAFMRVMPLLPAPPAYQSPEEVDAIWAEMDRVAERISAGWPEGVSAAQAISEDRRDFAE